MQVGVNIQQFDCIYHFYLPASGVLPSGKAKHLQPVVLFSQYLPKLSAFTQAKKSELLLDKT